MKWNVMEWFRTWRPFRCLVEKWDGMRCYSKENIPSRSGMHPFCKISLISMFLYDKTTPRSLTFSVLLPFFMLKVPHACSTLIFLESAPFHSPTKHKNWTSSFYLFTQTKHKNGINPFLWNGTMALHSTWFTNQTHPLTMVDTFYALQFRDLIVFYFSMIVNSKQNGFFMDYHCIREKYCLTFINGTYSLRSTKSGVGN